MEILLNIGLYHFLTVAVFLFVIGLLGIVISKNLIRIFVSLLIMFCGIALNFGAFSVFCDFSHFKGAVFALFIMILAVLHIVVCLAVLSELYKFKQSSDIEDYGDLKG